MHYKIIIKLDAYINTERVDLMECDYVHLIKKILI